MTPVRVLLIDDHTLVRNMLRDLLSSEPGIETIGEAEDGREGLLAAADRQPDVVITDLKMKGMDGIEFVRELQKRQLGSKVVILTMYKDPIYVDQALEAGAQAYVLKGGDFSELIQAIQSVTAGERYLSPALLQCKE